MRARNLKPSFFKNCDLADAGPLAQLLFTGLWCIADKEGRLKDQPRVIKAEIFPYYDCDVDGELTKLERLSFIRRYVSLGMGVIEICNFKKHQSPHHTERASDLPPPPDASACSDKTHESHETNTVSSPLSNGGNPSDSLLLIPDSGRVVRDGRERKGNGLPPLHASLPLDAWEEWLAYRREKRLSMSPRALAKQLKLLARYPTETQREIIDTSINAGWGGLFPSKGKQQPEEGHARRFENL